MAERTTGLEIDTDRPFQEKFWTFQRGAWIAMLLIIVAALAGLTGSGGPLAQAKATGPGGTIDYPRVARWQAAERMVVTVPPSTTGSYSVELESAFSRTFAIEDIEPQPSRSLAIAAGHRFEFELGPGSGAKAIVFHVRAARPAGPMRVETRLGDGPPLAMRLAVLP